MNKWTDGWIDACMDEGMSEEIDATLFLVSLGERLVQ